MGTRTITDLSKATNLSGSDITLVVNGGLTRNVELSTLRLFFESAIYYRGSIPSATYTIGPAAQSAVPIEVLGASLGDFAVPSVDKATEGLVMTASVTAANSVAVVLRNDTNSAITLPAAIIKALVIK